MKKAMLLFVSICALSVTACGNTSRATDTALTEPRDYAEAMNWIRDEVESLDQHVNGGEYSTAVAEAGRIMEWSNDLGRFEPPRSPDNLLAYEEFDRQVDDLRLVADRLLYYLEQRRQQDSRDQLIEFATRYNRLSTNFGPNYQVSVLGRDANELQFERVSPDDVPNEVSGGR